MQVVSTILAFRRALLDAHEELVFWTLRLDIDRLSVKLAAW